MRYPGGKGKCFQHIINLMPPHQTYIESHLGGGAVLRNKKPAKHNFGIDIDPKVIQCWEKDYVDYCKVIKADAADFLDSFNFTGGELVYADPPYYPDTRRRAKVYAFDYQHEDHERLLKVIRQLPCMVMISGYDHQFYNDQLAGWRKVTFSNKTHTDVREECVWLNFEPTVKLHDPRYFGGSFRERQTFKRRQQRLFERIKDMNPIERNELIHWLNKTYKTESGEV